MIPDPVGIAASMAAYAPASPSKNNLINKCVYLVCFLKSAVMLVAKDCNNLLSLEFNSTSEGLQKVSFAVLHVLLKNHILFVF